MVPQTSTYYGRIPKSLSPLGIGKMSAKAQTTNKHYKSKMSNSPSLKQTFNRLSQESSNGQFKLKVKCENQESQSSRNKSPRLAGKKSRTKNLFKKAKLIQCQSHQTFRYKPYDSKLKTVPVLKEKQSKLKMAYCCQYFEREVCEDYQDRQFLEKQQNRILQLCQAPQVTADQQNPIDPTKEYQLTISSFEIQKIQNNNLIESSWGKSLIEQLKNDIKDEHLAKFQVINNLKHHKPTDSEFKVYGGSDTVKQSRLLSIPKVESVEVDEMLESPLKNNQNISPNSGPIDLLSSFSKLILNPVSPMRKSAVLKESLYSSTEI